MWLYSVFCSYKRRIYRTIIVLVFLFSSFDTRSMFKTMDLDSDYILNNNK